MFVYQNGKLYVQDGNKIVGVEIYPNSVKKVKGTETKQEKNALVLNHFEVQAKFQLKDKNYIFPQEPKKEEVEVKGEVTDGTTSKTKATPRKSTRK